MCFAYKARRLTGMIFFIFYKNIFTLIFAINEIDYYLCSRFG